MEGMHDYVERCTMGMNNKYKSGYECLSGTMCVRDGSSTCVGVSEGRM